jgi:hypothetical protein
MIGSAAKSSVISPADGAAILVDKSSLLMQDSSLEGSWQA